MSALGHKQTFRDFRSMSALSPKADIDQRSLCAKSGHLSKCLTPVRTSSRRILAAPASSPSRNPPGAAAAKQEAPVKPGFQPSAAAESGASATSSGDKVRTRNESSFIQVRDVRCGSKATLCGFDRCPLYNQKADIDQQDRDVRFVPKADSCTAAIWLSDYCR